MNGKKILVTGYKGFLGSSLIRELKKYHCQIVGVTRNKETGSVDESVQELVGNYSVDFWAKAIVGVDIIYLFAAQTSSAISNKQPFTDLQGNLLPTVSLVQACLQTGLSPRIIFAGSVTQVGPTMKTPVNELLRDNPVTIYDVNKLASEKYLQVYANQMGGRAVTLRLANLYGPGPISSSADRGILNMMVRRALTGGNLTVYGTGEYIRDYVFIDDVVQAFIRSSSQIEKTNGKYYLIGSGQGHSLLEMMTMVKLSVREKVGKNVDLEFVSEPAGTSVIEQRNFVADTNAIQTDSGWKPTTDLKTGIEKTIEYYLR